MIEKEDFRLPKEEKKRERPKADPATLEYLESLPWRPHGMEW